MNFSMKNLKDYLNEGLISRKITTKAPIKYKPKTKEELQNIIIDLLKKGITDLNCIDVSNITDMGAVFYEVNNKVTVKEIDISEWDVSNVANMRYMFCNCKELNSDLSNWNVSKVVNMQNMFVNCEIFNSDLSEWDVSNVKNMWSMFYNCKKINSDLSNWNASKVEDMEDALKGCTTLLKNNKIPDWYKGSL